MPNDLARQSRIGTQTKGIPVSLQTLSGQRTYHGASLHALANTGRYEKTHDLAHDPTRRTGTDYSGLMFATRIKLPHFSVSSAMSLANSAGEPGSAVPPNSASRALIFGSAKPALISLLSLSMISACVFLGAPMPNHVLASKPGTNSLTVGIFGSTSERTAVVTASARSFPTLMYSIDEA